MTQLKKRSKPCTHALFQYLPLFVIDSKCLMQKGAQPRWTWSEVYNFLLLHGKCDLFAYVSARLGIPRKFRISHAETEWKPKYKMLQFAFKITKDLPLARDSRVNRA